jgi:hypothetical protein
MIGFLSGYKTYITVGVAAAAFVAHLTGLITEDQLRLILTGLGIPAVGFLRAAISRQSKEVKQEVQEVKRDLNTPFPTNPYTGGPRR